MTGIGWDALHFVGLLLPSLAVGALLLRGYAPGLVLWALLRRYMAINLLFTALIALSMAVGVALTAQERALRAGTAQAAEGFDVIIAAPGSDITVMLAAVYLQPSALPLLDGAAFDRIATHPRVALAAPIAFGDSYQGAPVVGVTAEFITHLSGPLAEGQMFTELTHAVAGAQASVGPGDSFVPAHGVGTGADADAHGDFRYTVTGRLAPTGSPWDRALLVPIESVWDIHGMAPGHGPDWDGTLGPPFAPRFFPGTPAVMVVPDSLPSAYILRGEFSDTETMAFFPGAVLNRLHGILGDVRQVMSWLALLTQALVVVATMGALVILTRLLAPRLALLRALGAPPRFVVAVVWSFATSLLGVGAICGLALGAGATNWISHALSDRTEIAINASIGWPELHMAALFLSSATVLALLPAFFALRHPVPRDLRR